MWSGHKRRTLKLHKKLEKRLISCEISRFCWSEWGDSNSRHLDPKDESKIMHILFVISSQLFYKTTYF